MISLTTGWGVLVCLLVVAELLTGSLYLLMLAGGATVGAICAMAGLGVSVQVAAASAAGIVGTTALYMLRKGREEMASAADALDVGSEVQVEQWDAAERTRVQHRGAKWSARWVGDGTPMPGAHRVIAMNGNVLELAKA